MINFYFVIFFNLGSCQLFLGPNLGQFLKCVFLCEKNVEVPKCLCHTMSTP